MPANTPIYNFPYPLGTDPVAQGDNDIRALAEDVETVIKNQTDNIYASFSGRNRIINGDFRVSQRFGATPTSVADGAYGLDRWVVLGSGTGGSGISGQNVGVIQLPADSSGANGMLLQTQNAGLKFGCVQIIENRNLGGIRAGTVTVSFKAAVSNGAVDVRCAVLGWTGTADVVTRDVVAATASPWLSSPPTLATNWSYLNTPVDLNVTNTLDTYRVSANVTGNPNNVAVFIWVNGTTHNSFGTLELRDVQLESGAIATPFERKTFQEQLADCQRYFQRLTTNAISATAVSTGIADTIGTAFYFHHPLKVTMRATPTNSLTGAWQGYDGSVSRTITSITSTRSSPDVASGDPSYSGGTFNALRPVIFNSAGGTLDFASEL